jgi:hypothetical protein
MSRTRVDALRVMLVMLVMLLLLRSGYLYI